MHKEEQQAAGGSPVKKESTLNLVVVCLHLFILNSASCIFHSESASGCDASADSTTEADLGISVPHDSIPQQQG
ncbi:hypothetical protein Tco_0504344, partial [Tanacetum coccineum]